MVAVYILDFEAFQVKGRFYPVEVCLLNSSPSASRRCIMYRITWSQMTPHPTDSQNLQHQYDRHQMNWLDGTQTIDQCAMDICQRLQPYDEVWVKGDQKFKYVQQHLLKNAPPRLTVCEIKNAPAYKNLASSPWEACQYHASCGRGACCARRKAHQMLPYIHQQQQQSPLSQQQLYCPFCNHGAKDQKEEEMLPSLSPSSAQNNNNDMSVPMDYDDGYESDNEC